MTMEGIDILELLKTGNSRLSCGNRWLYWENDGWIVRENSHGVTTRVVYCGERLDEALKVLKE